VATAAPLEIRGAELRRALNIATFAWLFGSAWMTAVAGTPFTNFAKTLKASEFQFGLLAAMPFMASLVSLPATLLIEATGQRKRIYFGGIYVNRGMWALIGLLPYLLVRWYGLEAIAPASTLFLMLVFIMHAAGHVGGPAWVSWMADLVPDRLRGRHFSRRRQMGIITAVPTALLVGWLLDHYVPTGQSLQMLQWCTIIFCTAAVLGVTDVALFHLVPEIPKPPRKGRHLLKAWREPLTNPQFLWFGGFVATIVFSVSFMGQFITLQILRVKGGSPNVNIITQTMLLAAPALAQLFVARIWGRAADRMGKRPLLILAALGLVPVGASWCFVTADMIWLGYLLAATGAALWVGVEVANLNLVLEVCGSSDEDNPTSGGSSYFAINSVIINIAGCLGGLASGLIAQWLKDWHWNAGFKILGSYDVLFLISAAMRLLAVVVFLPHVHEPTARPTREVMRYMLANIYNNLFNAVMLPLRAVGIADKESYDPSTKGGNGANGQ
jgi:MFS family permease